MYLHVNFSFRQQYYATLYNISTLAEMKLLFPNRIEKRVSKTFNVTGCLIFFTSTLNMLITSTNHHRVRECKLLMSTPLQALQYRFLKGLYKRIHILG